MSLDDTYDLTMLEDFDAYYEYYGQGDRLWEEEPELVSWTIRDIQAFHKDWSAVGVPQECMRCALGVSSAKEWWSTRAAADARMLQHFFIQVDWKIVGEESLIKTWTVQIYHALPGVSENYYAKDVTAADKQLAAAAALSNFKRALPYLIDGEIIKVESVVQKRAISTSCKDPAEIEFKEQIT